MVGFELRLEFLITHGKLRMPSIVLDILLRNALSILVISSLRRGRRIVLFRVARGSRELFRHVSERGPGQSL
jgi:hypothetical protein